MEPGRPRFKHCGHLVSVSYYRITNHPKPQKCKTTIYNFSLVYGLVECSVDLGQTWLILTGLAHVSVVTSGSARGWWSEMTVSWDKSALLHVVSYPPVGKPGLVVMAAAGFWVRVEVSKIRTFLAKASQRLDSRGKKMCPFLWDNLQSHVDTRKGRKLGAN